MAVELLAATTDAAQSNAVKVESGENVTFILFAASGLSASQYGDLQISHDKGKTWADLYTDGTRVRMHSLNNAVTAYGPGMFRVDKDATTNATGVWCSRNGDL